MNSSPNSATAVNAGKTATGSRLWWKHPEIAVLVLLVAGIYLTRLTAMNVRGEETRWGRGAAEMIESGDWIVPRQQGDVFPDRPPLASWLMALVGLVRGQVDLVAIRLPSVLALLATALLLYAYCSTFLSRLGSLAAAASYVTMGQVLAIGRLGENDAVLALLMSSALFTWHYGYRQGWPKSTLWAAGYAFAGLATLQKGIQAPVYFGAATVFYLVLQRDWRTLFSLGHVAGLAAWLAVVSAWYVPFGMLTDWQYATKIWITTVRHRYVVGSFWEHVATYPFETFACLLPWSGLIFALARPAVWRQLADEPRRATADRPGAFWGIPDQVWFVLMSVAITYPTVWGASNGRTRYFLLLYPCLAVVIGWAVHRLALAAKGTAARQAWDHFLIALAVLSAASGPVLLTATFAPVEALSRLAQPPVFAVIFAIAAIVTGACLLGLQRSPRPIAAQAAVLTLAAFLGLAYTGAVTNATLRSANDLMDVVGELKREKIPDSARLTSFGPVQHRFVFCYGRSIPQIPWPRTADELPDDVSYFCFDLHPGDTAERRSAGREWNWKETSGTLPFEWEQLAVMSVAPTRGYRNSDQVVVGRVIRPVVARQVGGETTSRK